MRTWAGLAELRVFIGAIMALIISITTKVLFDPEFLIMASKFKKKNSLYYG